MINSVSLFRVLPAFPNRTQFSVIPELFIRNYATITKIFWTVSETSTCITSHQLWFCNSISAWFHFHWQAYPLFISHSVYFRFVSIVCQPNLPRVSPSHCGRILRWSDPTVFFWLCLTFTFMYLFERGKISYINNHTNVTTITLRWSDATGHMTLTILACRYGGQTSDYEVVVGQHDRDASEFTRRTHRVGKSVYTNGTTKPRRTTTSFYSSWRRPFGSTTTCRQYMSAGERRFMRHTLCGDGLGRYWA